MQQMHAYSKKYDDIFGKHDDMFALCSKYKHPPENIMIFFEKYHDNFGDMRNFAAYSKKYHDIFQKYNSIFDTCNKFTHIPKHIMICLIYAAKLRISQQIS